MCMIIAMHYLQKGGLLLPLWEEGGVANLLAWLIEALCIGAANTYVLISGYFLAKASWKWQKLVSLTVQVLAYSVGISLVCLGLGIGNVAEWNLYDWITVIIPLQSEHYWFATAYVAMYLFAPVLQAGVKGLTKKQFKLMLVCLLVFFSLEKTFSPVALASDRYGYDVGWFICLFLIAAYFRLYESRFPVGKKAWAIYTAAAVLIWLFSVLLAVLTGKGLPLSYMGDMLYSYNHLLVLLLSVALFRAFGGFTIKEGFFQKVILRVSPYCLGVYLLHEHIALRHLWQGWLGIEKVRGSLTFLPHMLLCIGIVLAVGIMADCIRSRIFGLLIRKSGRKKEGDSL